MKKGNFPDGFDLDMRPVRDFIEKLDSMFQKSFRHLHDHFDLNPFYVEVRETEKSFIVHAELPGIDRNQIELEIIGNRLRISVDDSRSMESKDEKNNVYHKQQSYERRERMVSIPYIIPPKETKATFENGLLTITIPKKDDYRRSLPID